MIRNRSKDMNQHSTYLTVGAIGAALLAALLIVTQWIKSSTGQADGHQAREAIFAAVVKSEMVRAKGQSPEQAADLFAQALSLWVGTPEDWEKISGEHGLYELEHVPQVDIKEIIVLYAAPLTGPFPSNRLAIKGKVKELAEQKHLKWAGLLHRPAAFNPLRSGFSVG